MAEFGVDGFIKLWIAIEALTMNGPSTKPLVTLLAEAYDKDARWVQDSLRIERLKQMRGDIMHNGKMPVIRGDVLRYLVAIYEDALAHRLGLSFERRAESLASLDAVRFL